MSSADPTYPLHPVACILAALLLLFVLLTSFVRQSWNLGVAFLCFWLFLENIVNAVGAIVWSDNFDVKLYVYCDIVSRLHIVGFCIRPMATLMITRRLYLIVSQRSVSSPSRATERRNLILEWTLGLALPLLVAGPFYYIVQVARFVVVESVGCTNDQAISVLSILLIQSWGIVPPLISVVVYYPKVAYTFHRQSRDVNRFLRSDNTVSRTNYFRILGLASIDILLTLPVGMANLIIIIASTLKAGYSIPFYPGWSAVHASWEPFGLSYADQVASGPAALAQQYLVGWIPTMLAFVLFGLFGLTVEARMSYWRILRVATGCFRWKPAFLDKRHLSPSPVLGTILFGSRHTDTTLDVESGTDPDVLTLRERTPSLK